MKKVISLLIVLAMTVSALPALAVTIGADIETGLVLHYSFDTDAAEPDVIIDGSGNGNDAVVLNNIDQEVKSGRQTLKYTKRITIENGIAYFPGFERVSVGNRNSTVYGAAVKLPEKVREGLSDYTVSMWVKPDESYDFGKDYGFGDRLQRFFDFGIGERDSIFLRYRLSDGNFRFQDRGIGSSSDDAGSLEETTQGALAGKWSLITVTYSAETGTVSVYVNGGEPVLYADGKFTRSIGDIGTLTNDSYGMFLGRTQWFTNSNERENNPDYKGYMDDVRIYDRALSSEDVNELYARTNPAAEKLPLWAVNPEAVTTLKGFAPTLPSEVWVKYTNGSRREEAVEWDGVSPEQYGADGSFYVNGTAAGLPVRILVNVTSDPKQSINVGMVLHYDFESDSTEPSTIKDVSGSGNDAAVLNTVQNSWTGNVNNKLKVQDGKAVFPGYTMTESLWGSFANTGAALKLPNNFNQGIEDYTVSMWIKADSGYSFADKAQRIFDFGNRGSGGNNYTDSIFAAYTVDTSGAAYNGMLEVKDRGINVSINDGLASGPFTDKWGQLTVSYSKAAEEMTIYINGEKWNTVRKMTRSLNDLGVLDDSSNGLYIGRNQWHSDWGEQRNNPDFCGMMDEIRIYNRALDKEEVAVLYDKTNPERKITVTVNTVIYDDVIDEAHAVYVDQYEVQVPENSRYSVDSEAAYEYGGKVYTLSDNLSRTYIDEVTEDNCNIRLVYAIKKAESIKSMSVETYKGRAPELPSTVEVTYQTGDREWTEVDWEQIAEEKYSAAGEFGVQGTAAGISVSAKVTVFEIIGVDVAEYTYTQQGTAPKLSSNAKVIFSHRPNEAAYENIVWDKIADEQLASGNDFTVNGRLEAYPDVAVSTKVVFVFEAEQTVTAVADTYTSTENNGRNNYGSAGEIKITSTGGSGAAGYDRVGFFRFPACEMPVVLGAKLRLFVRYIDNNRNTTYTVLAMDPEKSDWDENELTWNNQDQYLEGEDALILAQATLSPSTRDEWLEFDISQYVANNPELEYYNFCVICDTCATYLDSREYGRNSPSIVYSVEGQKVTVNYMCGGRLIQSENVAAPKNMKFVYGDMKKAIVKDAIAYVYESGSDTIENVDEDNCTINIEMKETSDVVFEDLVVKCLYYEQPTFPDTVKATVGGYELTLSLEAEYDNYYEEPFMDSCTGYANGMETNIQIWGYGYDYTSRIYLNYVADGVEVGYLTEDVPVGKMYYVSEKLLNILPQIMDPKAEDDGFIAEMPIHSVTVSGTLITGVSGNLYASLSGTDSSAYELIVSATTANMDETDSDAGIVIVKYDGDGKVASFKTQRVDLAAGEQQVIRLYDTYNHDIGEDIRIYLWEFGALRPIADGISVSELKLPDKYSDEIMALIPEYEDVKGDVLAANDYWQTNKSYDQRSFWDIAAYHTGNMETYFTFGGEKYLQYSKDWANARKWMGNVNTWTNKDSWTWDYPSGDSNSGAEVLHGDWQICFQTYLDLYMLDPDNSDISRVEEVMGYQITKDNDDFWWWADALYMVPPVMTKLYRLTGNEKYLDKMYEYYRFSAELMYDGDLGIPNEGEEYTTSAEGYKKNGAAASDPDNYANLFFRDAGYVYPLSPNPGHAGEKNFWARGNGWVLAGLAKILSDIPEDYKHRDFFETIYNEMAKAIIDCQQVDKEGRGFWTQSMLQDYPKGSNGNDEGYETSGTAFFTYGLFWGLNKGMLDEETYLEPALRGWKFLSEIALQDNGKVGYCQPIGSNATQATSRDTDQSFGYGAFLLAGCEASLWVGGVTENNAPYLARKMWGSVAFNGGKYYVGGNVTEGSASFEKDGMVYVPAVQFAQYLGASADRSENGIEITDEINAAGGVIMASNVVEIDSVAYVPVELMARLLGKHVISFDGGTIVSHKLNVFYDGDENSMTYLAELLK